MDSNFELQDDKLQVRINKNLKDTFKKKASKNKDDMAELIRGWILDYLEVKPSEVKKAIWLHRLEPEMDDLFEETHKIFDRMMAGYEDVDEDIEYIAQKLNEDKMHIWNLQDIERVIMKGQWNFGEWEEGE